MVSRVAKHLHKHKNRYGHQGLIEYNWTDHYVPNTPYYEPHTGPLRVYPLPNVTARDQTVIDWPYPPASVQVFEMTGWDGNQLPGSLKQPWHAGYNAEWFLPTYQDQNHLDYTGNSFGAQMGMQESSDVLGSISQAWQRIRNGG